MTTLTPPFTSADRQALRARLVVERPLHWTLARGLLTALEAAWDELDRLAGLDKSGRRVEGDVPEHGPILREEVGHIPRLGRIEQGLSVAIGPEQGRP